MSLGSSPTGIVASTTRFDTSTTTTVSEAKLATKSRLGSEGCSAIETGSSPVKSEPLWTSCGAPGESTARLEAVAVWVGEMVSTGKLSFFTR